MLAQLKTVVLIKESNKVVNKGMCYVRLLEEGMQHPATSQLPVE